ncbi:MAG: hypothetical protein V4584_15305 [Verrucomicrobiota bacterium]
MKRTFVLLLVVSVVACREEKKRESPGDVPAKSSRTVVESPRSAAALGLPPHLLVTPRVTVSSSGMAVGFGAILNSAQAEAVLADIRTLPASTGRDRAIGSIIVSLASVDPGQARTLLEKWNDGLISRWLEAAEAVAKNLAKSDPEVGARFIEESVPRAAQADVWNRFLADLPPAERVGFLERIPESSSKLRMGASLVLVWLREDPASCAAWLDDFAAGKSPEELEYSLSNPSFYPQPMKTEASAWLAGFRAAKGAESREILAKGVWKNSEDGGKAGLVSELQDVIPKQIEGERGRMIEADPAAYSAALSPSQVSGISRDDMGEIISSWAKLHPLEAIQWALDHGRPEAAKALGALYLLEPKNAIALASKLPAGSDRDQAISGLCYSVARDAGPEAAKAMLPLISNPEFREGMRKEIDRDWD